MKLNQEQFPTYKSLLPVQFIPTISLHHVQLLLGHRSPTTTTVYLHVSRLNLAQVTSPLDKAAKQTS